MRTSNLRIALGRKGTKFPFLVACLALALTFVGGGIRAGGQAAAAPESAPSIAESEVDKGHAEAEDSETTPKEGAPATVLDLPWELLLEEEFPDWGNIDLVPLEGYGVFFNFDPSPARFLSRTGSVHAVPEEVWSNAWRMNWFGIAPPHSEVKACRDLLASAWTEWLDQRAPAEAFADSPKKLAMRRGLLEHLVTYADEGGFQWAWRVDRKTSYALLSYPDKVDSSTGSVSAEDGTHGSVSSFSAELGASTNTPTVVLERSDEGGSIIVFEPFSGAYGLFDSDPQALYALPQDAGCVILMGGEGWIFDKGKRTFRAFAMPTEEGWWIDSCLEGEFLYLSSCTTDSRPTKRLHRIRLEDLVEPPPGDPNGKE